MIQFSGHFNKCYRMAKFLVLEICKESRLIQHNSNYIVVKRLIDMRGTRCIINSFVFSISNICSKLETNTNNQILCFQCFNTVSVAAEWNIPLRTNVIQKGTYVYQRSSREKKEIMQTAKTRATRERIGCWAKISIIWRHF